VADIFNEVDDDLKRDRAERLWKAYGNYVLGAAVAAVLATAGWTFWTDYQHKQAAAEGDRFFAAASKATAGDIKAASPALDALAHDGRSGYRALAQLYDAGLKSRNGDLPGAIAIYRSIANDASGDPDLRDAAAVLGALASVETVPAAEIDAMLARLTTGTSPWRFAAYEVAAIASLRAGKADRAKELYAKIADDAAAPQSSRARAAEMLQAIGS